MLGRAQVTNEGNRQLEQHSPPVPTEKNNIDEGAHLMINYDA